MRIFDDKFTMALCLLFLFGCNKVNNVEERVAIDNGKILDGYINRINDSKNLTETSSAMNLALSDNRIDIIQKNDIMKITKYKNETLIFYESLKKK